MKQLMTTLTLALLASTAFAAPEAMLEVETVELTQTSPSQTIPKGGSTTVGSNSGIGNSNSIGGIVGSSGGIIGNSSSSYGGSFGNYGGYGSFGGTGTGFDKVGMVLSTASSVVALGEQVYSLVQKGKPSNTTDYAPISVVPKDPTTKEVVNPFDLENCSMPVQKSFLTTMKSAGIEVVSFEYMVVYSYGCSYEGAGKYIQTLVVIPKRVKTSYGWDFNASMKLSGIMNHGTKASPVVGALLTIKYSMNSWKTALERNDTVHVTGAGALKTYSM